jgi:ElaB/YqjD/DUF883 family membrane-anchored ribosome-binding protein
LKNLDLILIFKETLMKASTLNHNVDDTVNHLKSGAHDVMDKVANASSQAAEALSKKGEELHSIEQSLVKNCRGYLQDNPVAALGIAVGVGFLISRLFSSR